MAVNLCKPRNNMPTPTDLVLPTTDRDHRWLDRLQLTILKEVLG
jgi:hypothetical protein